MRNKGCQKHKKCETNLSKLCKETFAYYQVIWIPIDIFKLFFVKFLAASISHNGVIQYGL